MKSMTGFGKSQFINDRYQIDVEMKSVNQRFLDPQFRMPRILNEQENELRQLMKKYLTRGRVEVYITLSQRVPGKKEVVIDWALLENVINEVTQQSASRFDTVINPQAMIEQLVVNDSFFNVQEVAEEDAALVPAILATYEEALVAMVASRRQEGELLKAVLLEQKASITEHVAALKTFVSVFEAEYEERLTKKIAERMDMQLDQSRILTELAILLERGDIHEELDRLDVHLTKLGELFEQTQPVGRELDFLIQEFNREVNTIGSKSTAIDIKNHVVQLKTTIEKMREQVQNIE